MFQWLPFSFKVVPTLLTLSCRVLPDPAMPGHLFPSLTCSLLVSKANLFFSGQCFLPQPSQPVSPKMLLTHHLPCRSSLPSSPLPRLRCELLNRNLLQCLHLWYHLSLYLIIAFHFPSSHRQSSWSTEVPLSLPPQWPSQFPPGV